MDEIFLSELIGTPVVSTSGQEFGTLDRVTGDSTAGTLEDLIIEPNDSIINSSRLSTTAAGNYRCPIYLIDGVDNVIVVDV